MRLLGFMGALALIGAVGWWATGTQATRAGVLVSIRIAFEESCREIEGRSLTGAARAA